MNKYIEYKEFLYYLRYIKNKKIIYKCSTFSDMYKYIKSKKINMNSIKFCCTFKQLVSDYIYFESERI